MGDFSSAFSPEYNVEKTRAQPQAPPRAPETVPSHSPGTVPTSTAGSAEPSTTITPDPEIVGHGKPHRVKLRATIIND